jgi:TP901 family phage tail tape measure protein
LETRELLLLINVASEQLDNADATIKSLGQSAGVSSKQVDKIDRSLKASGKSFSTLSAQGQKAAQRITVLQNRAKGLEKALSEATDPKDINRLHGALKQVQKDLAGATKDANKLDRATAGVGSSAKRTSGIFSGFGKGVNLDGLGAKLGGIQGALGQVGFAAGGAGGGLLSLASAAGPVGAAIAAVIGVVVGLAKALSASVDIAKGYETNLASLSAITGLSGTALDDLSDRAQNFNIRIQDSAGELQMISLNASQAAQAFEVVGSKVPDLLKVPSALDEVTRQAAVLSETSLTLGFDEAVAGLTTSINQFLPVGVEYANAQEKANAIVKQGEILTNQLAAAQQLGAVPVTGLSQSLEKFGAVSVANNVSSAESIALAETLGQKFSDQATVGTNLRNIISILAADTTELGLSFKNTDGEVNGIQGSIGALQAKLESFDDPAERAAFLAKTFGRENAAAAQILVNSREQVEALTRALDEQAERSLANGAAAQQAAINAQTYAKAQERLRNTLNQVGNEIGQKLLPILTGLTNFLNDVIRRFDEVTEGLTPLRQAFGVLIDTISDLLDELGLAGNDIDFLGAAFTSLKFILEAVTAGLTFTVRVLSAVVDGIRSAIVFVKAGIAAFKEFADALRSFFQGDLAAFSGLGDRLKTAFLGELEQLEDIFQPTIREITNKLENIITDEFNQLQFGGDASNLANEIQAGLNAALEGVDPEEAAKVLETLGPTIRKKIDDAIDRGNIGLEQAKLLQAQLEGVIGAIVPDAAQGGTGATGDGTGTGGGTGGLTGGAGDKARKTLDDLQKKLKELKKERLKLDVDSPELPKLTAEILALETKIKTLKGEVKIELTPDEKRLDAIIAETQRTKAQLEVETDPEKIDELQAKLTALGQLEQQVRIKIDEGPFQNDIEKLLAEAEKFKREVEQRTIRLGVETAIADGDFETALDLTIGGIKAEAQRQKLALDSDPVLIRLFETDPDAGAKLKAQAIAIINQTQTEDIEKATEAFSKRAADSFVDGLIDQYSEAIEASSGEFRRLAEGLQNQLVGLTQSLELVQSVGTVGEASTILDALGLDSATILADAQTVEEATEAIRAQILGVQRQLLTENQSFANDFISQTQTTISTIETEIQRLEALQAEGEASEADTTRLEALRALYQKLQKDVEGVRGEVVGLSQDVADSEGLTEFEKKFNSASSAAQDLTRSIIAAGNALGQNIDPEIALKLGQGFVAAQKVIAGVQDATAAVFEFRVQKAEQTNADELAAIDEQIAAAEAKQRKGIKGQEKLLERLNEKRITLEEEREREVRKVREQEFKVNKAFNIVNAVMSGAVAFVRALEAGPILGPILAALVAAATAAQIATIASAKPQFFEGTEFVTASPGKAGKDSVDARLHHGERVVTAATNKRHFGDFGAIESGAIIPGAAMALRNLPASVQRIILNNPKAVAMALTDADWLNPQQAPEQAKKKTLADVDLFDVNAIGAALTNANAFSASAPEVVIGSGGMAVGVGHVRPAMPMPALKLSDDSEAALKSQHMQSAGLTQIDYQKLSHLISAKIAEQLPEAMYKMQHRGSSVDKYQLDALRFGFHELLKKLDNLNK